MLYKDAEILCLTILWYMIVYVRGIRVDTLKRFLDFHALKANVVIVNDTSKERDACDAQIRKIDAGFLRFQRQIKDRYKGATRGLQIHSAFYSK